MVDKMTQEEKEYVSGLNQNIEKRKLQIKIVEWKTAFEKLSNWIRKNFNEVTLFDVTSKIKELRPDK